MTENASRQLSFTGSHFEIGKQIGIQYKEWAKKELFAPKISGAGFQTQLGIYQEFFPNYIEWLRGIAEGAGFDEQLTLRSYLAGFLDLSTRPRNTCSALGLHKDGKVFVGRNYDWREAAEISAKKVSVTFPDSSAYGFTALSDMSVWQMNTPADESKYVIVPDDAWNEHGLFVCLNGAPGSSRSTGMSCVHIIQAVAEQCASTQEAIEFITKAPCNDPKIFTVIDRSGDMAVIEKPTDAPAQVIRSRECVIATNHFQSAALKIRNAEIFEHIPFHSTFGRQAYLETCIAGLAEPTWQNISNIIARPPVMQNWRGIEGDTMTVWTEVLELTSLQEKIAFAPLASGKSQ